MSTSNLPDKRNQLLRLLSCGVLIDRITSSFFSARAASTRDPSRRLCTRQVGSLDRAMRATTRNILPVPPKAPFTSARAWCLKVVVGQPSLPSPQLCLERQRIAAATPESMLRFNAAATWPVTRLVLSSAGLCRASHGNRPGNTGLTEPDVKDWAHRGVCQATIDGTHVRLPLSLGSTGHRRLGAVWLRGQGSSGQERYGLASMHPSCSSGLAAAGDRGIIHSGSSRR